MSGIEIVGVALGAFPLMISAMEHYEETKRVGSSWWRIRKTHKKDLGSLKDCNLLFRTHLKELLLPMLLEDVTSQSSYDDLLANPGGQGWREENVNLALSERLSDHHARYLEILEEMTEAIAKLTTECKVDDKGFQNGLAAKQTASSLMLNANIKFEAKRAAYAFSGSKRESLLKEVERYIDKLKDILASNDRVNAIAGRKRGQTQRVNVPKAFLQFWRHAESIFKVVKNAWQCQCTSKGQTTLWLRHRAIPTMDMRLLMHFCHGPSCIHVRLLEDSARTPPNPVGKKVRISVPPDSSSGQQSVTWQSTRTSFSASGPGPTITLSSSSSTWDTSVTPPPSYPQANSGVHSPGICELIDEGLCKATTKVCTEFGTLLDEDNDREYHVAPETTASLTSSSETVALSALLGAGPNAVPRVKRYGIALTVASSQAQLHSTSWMKSKWTLEDVRVPQRCGTTGVHEVYDHPCLHSALGNPVPTTATTQPDQSFRTLGIVLLELCFGTPLSSHYLWSDPSFPRNPADPIQRQAVALEWAQDVELEAGDDYAAAVHWCLQQSPTIVKDDRWRADFVQNVVQPLQRCHESMVPRKAK